MEPSHVEETDWMCDTSQLDTSLCHAGKDPVGHVSVKVGGPEKHFGRVGGRLDVPGRHVPVESGRTIKHGFHVLHTVDVPVCEILVDSARN